jgi:hypothetical protein
MKKSIYIESSISSYLTARTARDVRVIACQQFTIDWWEHIRPHYELFISELVAVEISRGDNLAAQKRQECLIGIAELSITDDVRILADKIILEGGVPDSAQADALHISIATIHCIDYLLTWNCRHIDNVERKPVIRSICNSAGYKLPEICTPMEFFTEE